MPVSKLVGARVKRREDPRLLRGLGHYVDDIRLIDTLCVTILRSPHAHAQIKGIHTQEALRHPGIVAVVSGEEIRDRVGTVPVAAKNPTLRVPPHHVLAVEKVCFVGEGVVAVVAEDRYTAQDGMDLIQVDYDPLPVVTDAEKALTPASTVIHSQWPDNVAFRWGQKQGNIDKAFKDAYRIVRQRFLHQRLAPIALEPRGVLAQYQPGDDQLTVWSSTQSPDPARNHSRVAMDHGDVIHVNT